MTTDVFVFLTLSNKEHPQFKWRSSLEVLIHLLQTYLEISPEETKRFIELHWDLFNDTSINVRASQKQSIKGDKALLLEKNVDKIVKICMDPNDIPEAMEKFATTLLQTWDNCDKEDLKAKGGPTCSDNLAAKLS